MANQVQSQSVFITGAGRGFGRATALAFAAAGAGVTVTARTESEITETARIATEAGGKMLAVAADVTDRNAVFDAVSRAERCFGPVDLLIHNAGVIASFGPMWEVDHNGWWQEMRVHAGGALSLIQAVVPGMVRRRQGRVILVSSIASVRVTPNASGYALSKGVLNGMAEHLAAEGGASGLRAFSIHPGGIVSKLVEDFLASPGAEQRAPNVFANVSRLKEMGLDDSVAMAKCAELCLKLASGRYDDLSGRYLTTNDDLDALLDAASQDAVAR